MAHRGLLREDIPVLDPPEYDPGVTMAEHDRQRAELRVLKKAIDELRAERDA